VGGDVGGAFLIDEHIYISSVILKCTILRNSKLVGRGLIKVEAGL